VNTGHFNAPTSCLGTSNPETSGKIGQPGKEKEFGDKGQGLDYTIGDLGIKYIEIDRGSGGRRRRILKDLLGRGQTKYRIAARLG
jgi:hypothetical protein